MSANPKSDRDYAGKFGVFMTYPQYILKNEDDITLTDAKTLSILIPYEEAINLAGAILKTEQKRPPNVEIKVDLRKEKRRKSDNLYPATVTFINK